MGLVFVIDVSAMRKIKRYVNLLHATGLFLHSLKTNTAQKIKFSIEDPSVNMTKCAGNCGFGHIYWRNP